MKRSITFFLLLVAVGISVGVGFRTLKEKTGVLPNFASLNFSQESVEKEKAQTVTLIFVGDIMFDRGVSAKIRQVGGGDFRFPFLETNRILESADLAIGNLEGPLSDRGSDSGKIYSFRMSPEGLAGLSFAGFDALSLANNHIGDWGREAIADTIYRLKSAGILSFGAGTLNETNKPVILERKGVKFAFLAFSDFQDVAPTEEKSGVAVFEEKSLKEAIYKARQEAQIIAVFFHFGEEYQKEPNERERLLAHAAVDDGADLVVGSHPHVIQPLEKYKGKYIAYSLGNFVFDQNFSEETMTAGLLKVILKGKSINQVELYRLPINNNFQPEFINNGVE